MPYECWRCKDNGFMRGPCQNCGRWHTAEGDVVMMVGSVWGDSPPPMKPKDKKRRKDR